MRCWRSSTQSFFLWTLSRSDQHKGPKRSDVRLPIGFNPPLTGDQRLTNVHHLNFEWLILLFFPRAVRCLNFRYTTPNLIQNALKSFRLRFCSGLSPVGTRVCVHMRWDGPNVRVLGLDNGSTSNLDYNEHCGWTLPYQHSSALINVPSALNLILYVLLCFSWPLLDTATSSDTRTGAIVKQTKRGKQIRSTTTELLKRTKCCPPRLFQTKRGGKKPPKKN